MEKAMSQPRFLLLPASMIWTWGSISPPWDAYSPLYHVDTEDKYNEYYLNQLKEILEDPKYGEQG